MRALLTLILLLASPAWAQYDAGRAYSAGDGGGGTASYTIATLPGSPVDGQQAIVTDGCPPMPCVIGGCPELDLRSLCTYDSANSQWTAAGGGGGQFGAIHNEDWKTVCFQNPTCFTNSDQAPGGVCDRAPDYLRKGTNQNDPNDQQWLASNPPEGYLAQVSLVTQQAARSAVAHTGFSRWNKKLPMVMWGSLFDATGDSFDECIFIGWCDGLCVDATPVCTHAADSALYTEAFATAWGLARNDASTPAGQIFIAGINVDGGGSAVWDFPDPNNAYIQPTSSDGVEFMAYFNGNSADGWEYNFWTDAGGWSQKSTGTLVAGSSTIGDLDVMMTMQVGGADTKAVSWNYLCSLIPTALP